MASRSHREIAITLALLAMANCAGPDALPENPFPSGGVIPTLQNTAHIWAFHGKNSYSIRMESKLHVTRLLPSFSSHTTMGTQRE